MNLPGEAGALLSGDRLAVDLEGCPIVEDASFAVSAGELVVIHGDNGCGKTTLLNALSGHLPLRQGRVGLAGVDISRWPAERRARAGLGRLFQQASAPRDLTVEECLFLTLAMTGRFSPASRSPGFAVLEARLLHSGAAAAIAFLQKNSRRHLKELSFAQQRLVEVVCALIVGSKVLLLDEPFAGVDAANVAAIQAMIAAARQQERAILVVEHATHLLAGAETRRHELKALLREPPGGAHG